MFDRLGRLVGAFLDLMEIVDSVLCGCAAVLAQTGGLIGGGGNLIGGCGNLLDRCRHGLHLAGDLGELFVLALRARGDLINGIAGLGRRRRHLVCTRGYRLSGLADRIGEGLDIGDGRLQRVERPVERRRNRLQCLWVIGVSVEANGEITLRGRIHRASEILGAGFEMCCEGLAFGFGLCGLLALGLYLGESLFQCRPHAVEGLIEGSDLVVGRRVEFNIEIAVFDPLGRTFQSHDLLDSRAGDAKPHGGEADDRDADDQQDVADDECVIGRREHGLCLEDRVNASKRDQRDHGRDREPELDQAVLGDLIRQQTGEFRVAGSGVGGGRRRVSHRQPPLYRRSGIVEQQRASYSYLHRNPY
jgi:hypothetical protein